MTERLTSIALRNLPGVAEWGLKTVPEMIALIREHAARQKAEAEAVLAAPDADFRVETYLGVHVRRKLAVLQEGAGG
jgi:hypothetical protein